MIGHRQIIDARKARLKPAAVFLHIGTAPAVGLADLPIEQELAAGILPTVYTADAKPATSDLRWLTGLRVHVLGVQCNAETFWKWFDAVKAVRPSHLIAVEPDGEVIEWRA